MEITPIYGVQGNDKNEISYPSPEWMDMLRYTEEENNRLYIETDMATGTECFLLGATEYYKLNK